MPIKLASLVNDLPTVKLLDVGASWNGKPTYQPLVDGGHVKIVGFDGDAKAAEDIANRLGGIADILPVVVGAGGAATFHENVYAGTNSTFPTDGEIAGLFTQLPDIMRTHRTTAVETVRLDDIDECRGADAMFLDVQGGELAVIEGARALLEDLLVIQTEVEFVPIYKNQPLFSDIDPVLRGQGFMFHNFLGFNGRAFAPTIVNNDPNAKVNQKIWSDAVYMVDPARYPSLSDTQLLKLALIMNDVYGSIDVVYVALLELDARNGGGLAGEYMSALTHG